jgi:competence protein ComFC
MLRQLLNLIFPKQCIRCKRGDFYLCPDCRYYLPLAELIPTRGATAVFAYHDPAVKRLIWLLKYRGTFDVVTDLADCLYGHLLEELAEYRQYYPEEKFVLLPVPLAAKRQKHRGFNQAEKLARALAKKDEQLFIVETRVLIKAKETISQVAIKGREARRRNLHGAFILQQPEKVAGRNVIIIDDVITTGGTIEEAQRVLKSAGARYVQAIAVAHG